MNKVKSVIEEYFDIVCEDDISWKTGSTDTICITCKVCKVPHNGTIKNIYAYVRDRSVACRYCTKNKCRTAIEEYFEILSEGVKLTTNSTETIKLKCRKAGHVVETSVHNIYVCCTTNKVVNKCTMCNKPYKHEFKTAIDESGQFESVKFESVKYFQKPNGGTGWKLYDAKVVTIDGKECYIEFDGPEHTTNPEVIANDQFKERLAEESGIPLVRVIIDFGDDLIDKILEVLD